MDSMTDKELDGKVDLHNFQDEVVLSRIKRIAKGSGTHPEEVKILLQTHKHFEGVASKVGKSGLMSNNPAASNSSRAVAEQLKRNPNQVMQHIQKNMDPKMVQQMGGASNMMNMMQQMAKMQGKGGNPAGLEAMMKQMGGGFDMAQMMQQMGGMPP